MEENNTLITDPEEEETVSGNDPGDLEPAEGEESGSQQPEPEQPEPEQDKEDQKNSQPDHEEPRADQQLNAQQYNEIFEEVLSRLEHSDLTDELAEKFDTMIQLLTPEEMEEEPVERSELAIPPSDYGSWDYPVNVTYGITTSTGYSTYASMEYGSADAFRAGFEKMEADVVEGSLHAFYVRYVYGLDDGGSYSLLLYDSENPVIIPEPEAPSVSELLLSHLEEVNSYLEDMTASDMEYYEACAGYREEMLKLQTAETACTFILCIAASIFIGMIMFIELFRRFK